MEQVDFNVIYPWLSKELFQRIIQKEYRKNVIQVNNYTISAALAKGENFGSQMLRAIVAYSINDENIKNLPNEMRFVIKVPVIDVNVREYLNEMKLFHNEILTFEYILPEVYKLLEGIDDYSKVSAK